MLVWEPFFYFPTFYQTKFWVQGRDPLDAWRTYCRNISSDIVDMWRFGVPAFFFNFTFCPMWARVPFVGLYSLFWTMWVQWRAASTLVAPLGARCQRRPGSASPVPFFLALIAPPASGGARARGGASAVALRLAAKSVLAPPSRSRPQVPLVSAWQRGQH